MRSLAAVVLCLLAIGCSSRGFKSAAAPRPFTTVFNSSPQSLDPARSQDNNTNDLMRACFEGLTQWGEDNMLKPGLAEDWELLEGGKRYRFKLREAKFSDGSAVTASDVAASWERACRPKDGSAVARNYLGDIAGVLDKLDGKADTISGIRVIDDRTLEVTLASPRPYFLGKLTYPTTYVLPARIAATGEIKASNDMVGSGPFKLSQYTPDQLLKLEPNPHYWAGPPGLGAWHIRIVKDSATRLNLFRANEIDVHSVSQQDLPGLRAEGIKVMPSDRAATVYVGMNGHIYKPFSDPRVRRAFVMAIDRQHIVDVILGGVGRVAKGIVPPAIPMPERDTNLPAFDPKAAKALLVESGWAGKMPPLDLWVNDANRDRRTIAEYIATHLAQNLGIEVKLRQAEAVFIIEKATRRELGFFYGSWYADYLDPENFLSVLLASYGQNRSNYDNPKFSELTRQADAESDPATRAALYAAAEDIALADCPILPLYHPQEVTIMSPRVTGLKQNAFGFLPPTTARVLR